MNIQRLGQLADLFEHFAERPMRGLGFSMGAFYERPENMVYGGKSHAEDKSDDHCGTVACIAGWTYTLWGDGSPATVRIDWMRYARPLLDLDGETAHALFCPWGFQENRWGPADAARVIRKLIETGEVTWHEHR